MAIAGMETFCYGHVTSLCNFLWPCDKPMQYRLVQFSCCCAIFSQIALSSMRLPIPIWSIYHHHSCYVNIPKESQLLLAPTVLACATKLQSCIYTHLLSITTHAQQKSYSQSQALMILTFLLVQLQ